MLNRALNALEAVLSDHEMPTGAVLNEVGIAAAEIRAVLAILETDSN